MTNRDIIVIGASAGGLEAVRTILRSLPKDLPASVFIVIHTAMHAPPMLAQLLDRVSQLPVEHAVDGELIERGRVYVAPPDRHMLVKEGTVELSHGPRENRFRPAIDPLFRSAARAYGKRVVGVILTGSLDDGTRGLLLIKRFGGLAVVQDLKDALYTGMPSSALEHVAVDHVAPVSDMAELFNHLTHEPLSEGTSTMKEREQHSNPGSNLEGAVPDGGEDVAHEQYGARSPYVCPECGGVMQELEDDGLMHYLCHVGHAYSAQTLLEELSWDVESALWTALRTLVDHADLHRRLADNARAHDRPTNAATLDARADETEQQAALIRKVLLGT